MTKSNSNFHQKITANWNGLATLAEQKKLELQKKLQVQQRMEELRREFAKLAKEYNRWATSAIDDANDHNFGETLATVEVMKV